MSDPTPPPDSAIPDKGPVRVLIVGTEASAEELCAELLLGGYEPAATRVHSGRSLEDALQAGVFDVSVCLDGVPGLDAPAALRLIKRVLPDLPVIVVSSLFGESVATAAMKAGAADFIGEGYMGRLVPAVEREMLAHGLRRGWHQAALSLREAEARSNAFMDNSPAVAFLKDDQGRYVYVNRKWEEVFGRRLDEMRGRTGSEILSDEDHIQARANDEAVLASNLPMQFEERSPTGGEDRLWHVSKFPFSDGVGRRFVGGVAVDITDRKRAEEALRESEDQYRDLMEHSHVLVCVHDLNGKILAVNSAVERSLGYDRKILLGQDIRDVQDILAPESRSRFGRYIETLKREGVASGTLAVRTLAGETRYWDYRNTVRRDGVVTPVVRGIAWDVTDRIAAETALTETRQFSEAIISSAGEGIIVHGMDLRYLLWNPFMEELTGLLREDVIGRDPRDLFPELMAGGLWDLLQKALQGEKTSARDFEFSVPSRNKSGWVSATFSPHRSPDGEIVGVIGIVEDASARKASEETLRESRESLERAQEVGQIGSWTSGVGKDDSLVWSRESCRIFGVDPDRFDGRLATFLERVHPEDLDALQSAVQQAIEKDHTYSIEHRIVRPDGTSRWVYERADVVRSAEGTPLRIVGIVQDITDRRRLEEQFLQAQKMEAIGRLAGGIAHDFNNLLTAILGYTDLLLSQVGEDSMRGDLEEIQKAGERAASLTKQLLAFSRRQMLEPKIVDVNGIIANLEKMLRRVIGEDVELVTSLASDLDVVRADPGQLEQVLLNLALNSRDAMPSGGTITITTSGFEVHSALELGNYAVAPGRYVLIEVRDTGTGMDSATLARVFEPFFTTKEQGKGTGLGLATAYGIVKQSGGYIVCESEAGHGTSFRVFLPRSLEATSVLEAPPRREARHGLRGSETVLLVEDEEGVRRLSRKLLEAHGYHVLEASAGAEAVKLAEEYPGPIHLILTDMVMPGLDGPEVAARVGALRPGIKILYMSGYSDAAPERLGAEAHLLPKPFTPDALARRVRELLTG